MGMIKMETRIRELESELDAETRRFGDMSKNLRKSERSIKELAFAADEDRRTTKGCRASLTSSRARSSPTRSRLRRQKRSLPSTWPSTGRLLELWEMLRLLPMLMSRQCL